jgi:hypothetical protein
LGSRLPIDCRCVALIDRREFPLFRADCSPEMVIVRTLALLITASLACSCSTVSDTAPDVETLTTGVKQGGQKVATATVRSAEAVGESVGTAYRGVTNGFENPANEAAYGPYPRDYVNAIRKHMVRFEGIKENASFQFGKPVRSYQNKGLLRGGDIDWQGWVVDVAIPRIRSGKPHLDEYVVRMKDGDVVEVIDKAYAGALRRVSDDPPPAPAAPQP